MKIKCLYDELVDIEKLQAHPENRNKHPSEQIDRLAKILEYQGWRTPIRVSKRSGFIQGGHGRLEAAKVNGWKQVPVNFQEYDNADQEYADLQSDNAIALWAELDLAGINSDLGSLGPDFDLDLLGIENFTLDFEGSGLQADEQQYSTKIESPIYKIQGKKPKVSELYDLTKTNELLDEIEKYDLKKEVKRFLQMAAQRHTVFDYENIAEYYAHAPKEIQILIENSAMVIIDFNKAIEKGFVKLTEEIAETYPNV